MGFLCDRMRRRNEERKDATLSHLFLCSGCRFATVTLHCIAGVCVRVGRWLIRLSAVPIHAEISTKLFQFTVATSRFNRSLMNWSVGVFPNVHGRVAVHVQLLTIWRIFWPVKRCLKKKRKKSITYLNHFVFKKIVFVIFDLICF